MIQSRSIVEIVNEHITTSRIEVPVFHPVALKLQQILATPGFTIEQVTQLITVDPGLVSQVLRMANSSFYSGLSKVTTIREAIVRLGGREVANIAMLATQKDLYRSADAGFNDIMQTLWKHAFCCAVGSRWLAGKAGFEKLAQEAFLAGLLHDIGKLFLLKVLEDVNQAGKLGRNIPAALLSEVLNGMHVEYGFLMMEKWEMPEIYCDVTRNHHAEEWKQSNALLATVRLVNQACNRLGIGMRPEPGLVLFATAEAQMLGLREITLAELEIAIEDALGQISPGAKHAVA